MKPNILILIFSLIILNQVFGQDDYDKLLNKDVRSNQRLDRFLAIDIRNRANQQAIDQKNRVVSGQPNYVKDIDNTFKRYKEARSRNEIGLAIVKGNNYLIKASLLCFHSKIKIPLLCDLADKGLTKVESMVTEQMNSDTRRLLKSGLNKATNEAGQEAVSRLRNSTSSQEFLDRLKPYSDVVKELTDQLGNATEEDKHVVTAALLKIISEEINNGFRGTDASIAATNDEIVQVKKNVASLSTAFYKYATANNARLDSIINTQRAINDQLQTLNDRIGKTEEGVQFLQTYFFGQMSPEDQINALKLGMVPGISEARRKDLIEKIELYKKQQDFNRSIQKFLSGSSEVIAIASKLGLDPKIATKLNAAVEFSSNAFNAFTAIESGNFIGALNAVSNIFGFGGGPDIATQRHEEIMNALTTIYEKLDVIDQKLNYLIEGQKQILKNQQTIYDAIVAVSQQIDRNQTEVREKLEAIHKDIIYDRQLIRNYVISKYTSCYRLKVEDATSPMPKSIISTEKNSFPTFEELDLFCEKWSQNDDIRQCFDILGQVRKLDLTFDNPIFNLQSSADPSNYNIVREFADSIQSPSFEFIHDYDFEALTVTQKFSSLFVPSTTTKSLDQKIEGIQKNNVDLSASYSSVHFPNAFLINLKTPLWYEAVDQHINFILDLHFYRMVINRDRNKPFEKRRLISRDVNSSGQEDLKNGLALADFAIAQQNMYDGDILLPMFFKIITDSTTDSNVRKKVLALVNHNSALARNFVMYAMRKSVLQKSKISTYGALYASRDVKSFKLAFAHDWDIHWSDSLKTVGGVIRPQGWSLKLGTKFYSLPNSDDLLDGRLVNSPIIRRLLHLKERLLEEIEGYEIFDQSTPIEKKERQSLNVFTLTTIPSIVK